MIFYYVFQIRKTIEFNRVCFLFHMIVYTIYTHVYLVHSNFCSDIHSKTLNYSIHVVNTSLQECISTKLYGDSYK